MKKVPLAAALAAVVSSVAYAIIVTSDPLGHSNGTPIAGTTATVSSTTASAILDVRATTSADLDGWLLSTVPPRTVIYVR